MKNDLPIPSVALGVVAHPDDLEFSVAGSVAKWASHGCDVYYYILTNGNKGSCDRSLTPTKLTDIRRQEQRDAAKILGVKDVFFSDYDDGTLQCDMDVKRDIARVVRRVKPEVVMTFDPAMLYSAHRGFINHPDHRAAGQATMDAVFPLARDHLSFPELLEEGLEPHNTKTILLNNFDQQNCFIDISDTMDLKLKALAAHASQIADMKATQALITSIAADHGQQIGAQYAEAFLRIDIR